MVTCLGHKEGTDCYFRTKERKATNWAKWQLCANCARTLHPTAYTGKPVRGNGNRGERKLPTYSLLRQLNY